MHLSKREGKALADYIRGLCGVVISEKKYYLIKDRLSYLVVKYDCESFHAFYEKLKGYSTPHPVHREIIDAITINETMFFRDDTIFKVLAEKVVPDILEEKISANAASELRIWSAASSTGQELYSIVFCLIESLGYHFGNVKVFFYGTDISNEVVQKARKGVYTESQIKRGIPEQLLKKYFDPNGELWVVKPEIRSLVAFEAINLLEPFAHKFEKFDIVFCRNVAIYFSETDKQKLFNSIYGVLKPHGYLFLGKGEALHGQGDKFKYGRYNDVGFHKRIN